MNTRVIKTNDLPEDLEETKVEEPTLEPEQKLEVEAPKEEVVTPPPEEPKEEEVLQITLGEAAPEEDDEEAEASIGDKGKRLVKKLRELAAEELKKNREMNARLALLEAQNAPKTPELKRPTLADCSYDEDEFASKLLEYNNAKRKSDEAVAKEAKRVKDLEDAHQALIESYNVKKKVLPVPDYDLSEETVAKLLTKEQQAIILRNASEPEKFVYALGRSKKHLEELAAITDLDRFAFKLAKMEGSLTVTRKSAPPPESKVGGGSSAVVSHTDLNAQLAAAERDAERTGNRTKVIEIKRKMREAKP